MDSYTGCTDRTAIRGCFTGTSGNAAKWICVFSRPTTVSLRILLLGVAEMRSETTGFFDGGLKTGVFGV
jgi:hypothetical protein